MSLVNKKGVDISSNNGSVDIAKIKAAGYDFVMIRCGFGENITSQDDNRWEENVRKCEAADIPWGAYFYSYACSESSAKSELEHALRLLKGKKPTMPVAFDMEDADGYKARHGGWNKTNVDRACRIFLEGIAKAGYYPMLYAGFEEMNNLISSEVWNKYDIWFPHWASACGYKGKNLCMWQYGGETNKLESNSIPGVGVIDKNICYKDYPTIIKSGGYNGWAKGSAATDDKPKGVTAQDIINTAYSLIGKDENRAKCDIMAWYGSFGDKVNEEPCCCAGQMYLFNKANALNLIPGGKTANCGTLAQNFHKVGQLFKPSEVKPGDLVTFSWSGNTTSVPPLTSLGYKSFDHVELCVEVNSTTIKCIGANNGGAECDDFQLKTRNRSNISGCCRPKYAGTTGTGTASKPAAVTTAIPDITYRVRVSGHWLSPVKNGAVTGIRGQCITDVSIKPSKGSVKYRVHIKGGRWLPFVTGYNCDDNINGYAGMGYAIDLVEVYYFTPTDVVNGVGYLRAKYRVSPTNGSFYDYQFDNEKTNGQDGYAGYPGKTIDQFQLTLSK